jgi:Uma2 family endonuclease
MTAIVTPAATASAAAPPRDDEPLFEIIDGERVEIPPMSAFASLIASSLFGLLFPHAQSRGHLVMETLFRLAGLGRNRRPDIAFVSYERWPRSRPHNKDDNAWDVVPNLAIEVVSPTDLAEELLVKMEEYFRAGVQLVWIVYPKDAQVYVYLSPKDVRILGRADTLDGGIVLPEFHLALADLFPAD